MWTGLETKEVAHDIQLQVASYVKNELKMVNSFDTWHGNATRCDVWFILMATIPGTKSVGKAMKVITEGAAKWQDKKWFPELVDKRMNSNEL